MQGFHHAGHPGKALVVPAHGYGDIDGLVQRPFQITQARHDDDRRAVLRLCHLGADAAAHDAARAHSDGRGNALHMFLRCREQNGQNGDVQQFGKRAHPFGDALIAGDGNGRAVLSRLHQTAQHGKMIIGNGHDRMTQLATHQTAGAAAPQNDLHAVIQQFPRHGQRLFHGGKTYFHSHAASLGVLADSLGNGAGIGYKGKAKRMLGHETSRADVLRSKPERGIAEQKTPSATAQLQGCPVLLSKLPGIQRRISPLRGEKIARPQEPFFPADNTGTCRNPLPASKRAGIPPFALMPREGAS